MGVRTLLLALCAVACLPSVRLCDWDNEVDVDQSLNPESLQSGAFYLGQGQPVQDPVQCQEACCSTEDCDLAQVGYPQDGHAQCFLIHCISGGQDVCALQPSTQFKVFKKVQKVQEEQTQSRGNDSNHVVCRLPVKVGSCRAAFPRFFYNVTVQKCQSFTYGGCDANANNFETNDECESTCSGVTAPVLSEDSTPESGKAPRMAPPINEDQDKAESSPDEPKAAITEPEPTVTKEMSTKDYAEHCRAELKVGPCRASFQRWFFNSVSRRCEMFTYGGCRGNKNNFENEESCRNMCTGITVLPSTKKNTVQNDDPSSNYQETCMVTSDSGPCRAAFPAFYYDHKTSTCRSFTYGGCRGNKNRYDSVDECMKSCSQGAVDPHARTQNRWTAAFFLFFAMTAISILLLATLVVITVKRRRLIGRSSSISDKEELLPDPDGSSLESLSLPETPNTPQA